jgi:heptosyltransferase-2
VKTVVFCPNWIGDAVMATPALRALRKLHPEGRLVGVMKPAIAATLAGNPWFDDAILCDPKAIRPEDRGWNVIGRLRREKFDLGVLLTNSLRSAMMAFAGGIRRRIGYAREARALLLTDRLRPERRHGRFVPTPIIDYYLALAYRLGAAPESYQMELFVDAASRRQVDDLWNKFGFANDEPVAVLNPGAAFGPAKKWPILHFSELARRLADDGVKSLVICGPEEREQARLIVDGGGRPRAVKSLSDETVSLGLSKAIIERAALLVTTDSGPRHFAPAFGVPVVSLFGPTHQEWTTTYYPLETALQKKLACGPCQQRICPLGHHRCMTELTVGEAYAACRSLLEADSTRKAA